MWSVTCWKCGGKGQIEAFGHYANGVCFQCKGSGVARNNTEAEQAKLSESTRRKANWILASTEASYAGLSYGKLLKIRNFSHGGFGLQEAYPTLRDHWFAVGEPAFQAAQEDRLAWLESCSLDN